MAHCLDAGVIIDAMLPQPASPAAAEFLGDCLRRKERLVAPPLLYAETTSVLRRHVHLGIIEHREAVAALRALFSLPIRVIADAALYLRALELAHSLGQPKAYDVQYLAVAQMEDCPVVTLDRGLYESARTLGIAAHLLP